MTAPIRRDARNLRIAALIIFNACLMTAAQASGPLAANEIAEIKALLGSDPQRAEHLARTAEIDAANDLDRVRRSGTVLVARWLRAEALIQLTRLDEATRVVDEALLGLQPQQRETQAHGDLLMSRASIGTMRGDAGRTLNDLQHAYSIYGRSANLKGQRRALQFMGLIYQNAGDYRRALSYYEQGDELLASSPGMELASSNNQGDALSALGRFADSERQYRKALGISRRLGNRLLEARILDNIARTQIRAGQLSAAHTTLQRGLALTRTGAASEWHPVMLGSAARLAVARRDFLTAGRLLTAAVPVVGQASMSQPYQDLHETAYRAFKQLGDRRRALAHFEAYTALDREGRALASSVNASLMAARFDFANQNSKITGLKAGQLERDVALERLRARQKALLLWASLAVVTIVAVGLAIYLRALRRSRNAIRQANASLSESNIQLKQALLAKSQFLATTSHEIRTPLNGVLGMTQVLLKDTGISDDVREKIQLLHHAGDTMRLLVDDLLQLAKLDAESADVSVEEMDIHKLMHDLVAFWQGQARGKGLELTLYIDRTVPRQILGDLTIYRQILSNLLSNAIKFTLHGTVAIKAFVSGVDTERLSITITDSGIGIPSHAFGVIFDKFHQLDSSTTRRFGGTGLGLAISRELAHALNGDVDVESELGQGSTFTLSLPLDRAPLITNSASRTDDRHVPEQLLDASVAITGGKPIEQSILRAVLLSNVSCCTIIDDLESAVDVDEQAVADIVLIDGSDLLKHDTSSLLRSLGRLNSLKIKSIVICGAPDAAMRPVLLTAGANAVMVRPINGKALVAQMNNLFGQANPDAPAAIAC